MKDLLLKASFLSLFYFLSLCAELPSKLKFESAFPYLKFQRPISFTVDPVDQNWAYVMEQRGKIWAFKRDKKNQAKTLIADFTKRLGRGNEEGLLSMTFHPQYPKKPFVYLYYSAKKPRRSLISRFELRHQKLLVQSEQKILEIPEPYGNHNGGQLAFGPDGFLYIGVGDGGLAGDPHGHGQNLQTLHGAILRIDIDGKSKDKNYQIPKDNPFVNKSEVRPEIYAYGLRNPWRFSFDSKTGLLLCADVGQNKQEEVNVIEKGGNYGWRRFEGTTVYSRWTKIPKGTAKEPIFTYGREKGVSITGGYTYRGSIKAMQGAYICADYATGRTFLLRVNQKGQLIKSRDLGAYPYNVASFAEDEKGELYLCSFARGQIFKLVGVE